MEDLTPCPHCQCHVRASEVACPFCDGVLPRVGASAQPKLPRGLSRAAAYAMRAAVVASVTSVVACGGDDDDDNSSTGQTTGGAKSDGGEVASGGTTTSGGTSSSETGGVPATGGDMMGQGGFTPIPIYGGVFPDPELRAKV